MTGGVIRTIIADDEPVALRGLRKLLSGDPDLRIIGEARSGAEAVAAVVRRDAELLFLDIEMPDKNGFECLSDFGDSPPVVVFVTAYEQYAVRAFEAQALDYILKPFSNERLRAVLNRAKQQVRQRRLNLGNATPPNAVTFATRLMVRSRSGSSFLSLSDVDWIEAAGYRAKVHASGHIHLVREPLHRLASRLDPTCFVRVHRSTIVRIDRIREVQPYFRGAFAIKLIDGTRLILSRRRRTLFEKAVGHHL